MRAVLAMSRSAADMISADGSGERLLSLRMNLDKTPMHAHGTWRTGAAKPPSPARRAEASGAALPRLGGAATASDDAPDRPLWSLQRGRRVAVGRVDAHERPAAAPRAHFEHADAAARDASLQRMFDVAEGLARRPVDAQAAAERARCCCATTSTSRASRTTTRRPALAAGGGEHNSRELLLLASRIGVEVPTPKPKRAPVPEARAAAVAGGDAPEPAAPRRGGAASAEAAPAAEQPPEVAEAAAAPAETAPAEGGAG